VADAASSFAAPRFARITTERHGFASTLESFALLSTPRSENPMSYVDGFVLVVPRKNIAAYKRIATKAGKVWRDHGALDYCESVGDDLQTKYGLPYGKLLKLKKDEVAVFSWILYKSRAARDRINAKVMKDKRLAALMDPKAMPFDMRRMSAGGFKAIVKV